MRLPKNQVLRFENVTLNIQCFSGTLWITWPDGNEMVLKSGQNTEIYSSGSICVTCFSPAVVKTEQTKNGFFSALIRDGFHWQGFSAVRI